MFVADRRIGETMKCKFLNKWFTRILLVCVFVLVYIGGWCQIHPDPYTTNPNLKLLVGDTTTDNDTIHCSNPVVSPDGNIIYYLCVSGASAESLGYLGPLMGSIYSINVNGTNNKKILAGKFDALSISHDGGRLAAHAIKGNYFNPTPESIILVIFIDTVGGVDIDSFWITPKWIEKIEWASGDGYLYFSAIDYNDFKTTIYRLNLADSTEEIVKVISGVIGFDLLKIDSVYVDDSIKTQPQIEPVNEKYAIGTYGFMGEDFLMRNFSNDTLYMLSQSCEPYGTGKVGFPYWFPDGNTIVFAACPYTGPSGAPAEIWVLENVFEQIEE